MKSHRATLLVAAACVAFGCGTESGSGPSGTEAGGSATAGSTNQGGSAQTSGAGGAPTGGGSPSIGGETASGGNAGTPSGGGGGDLGGNAGAGVGGAGPNPDQVTVVIFIIDGLQDDAAQTGIDSGADNLKFIVDNGVRVAEAHSTSPAPRLVLPGGALPWGNSTSGNVSLHTGTHLFESRQMDDIFLAARAAGIVSVFSGADSNYGEFDTPDFAYADDFSDEQTLQYGLDHLEDDGARLIRLHFQRIRDDWNGPAGKTNPDSAYIQHLIAIDAHLGTLIQTLKDAGVWDSTFVIVSADHGMGDTSASSHPSATRSSWDTFMAFYGPGIKRGATIPYAENPDIPVMVNHLFGLPPLQGHTDPAVNLANNGATGTLLMNIFEGQPDAIEHPRYVARYLETGTFADNEGYADYREGMLELVQ